MIVRLVRVWLGVLAGAMSATAANAPAPAGRYDRVNVAAAKTSIYVGSVTMTLTEFVRKNRVYEAAYTAKVVPYFFLNETGQLKEGPNNFVLEFRRASDKKLVDVGEVQLNTSMPMPGTLSPRFSE